MKPKKQPKHDFKAELADFTFNLLVQFYGKKCPDFTPHCHCCGIWQAFEQVHNQPHHTMTSAQKKKLEKIRSDLNLLLSEVQDDLDNSSESFKDSEKGELAAEHIEFIENAMSELDNIE